MEVRALEEGEIRFCERREKGRGFAHAAVSVQLRPKRPPEDEFGSVGHEFLPINASFDGALDVLRTVGLLAKDLPEAPVALPVFV